MTPGQLIDLLSEAGMLKEESPGVFGWHPTMEKAERFASLVIKREWEGLTEEDALRLWAGDIPRPVMGKNKVLDFARAIEAKLKERNT